MNTLATTVTTADPQNWVVYYWILEKKNDKKISSKAASNIFTDQLTLSSQQAMVANYRKKAKIFAEVTEVIAKKRQKFPILLSALELAKKYNAYLIIPRLHHLARYDAFSGPLLSSQWPFRCLDQIHVNQQTFLAIAEHARKQREIHRSLICIGLQNTDLPLGNPNAHQEITRINKPKQDHALIFSLVFAPIIHQLQQNKVAQRKMVLMLNKQGCLAPEGGHWVLSQLQKLLERISLNDCVLLLWHQLKSDDSKKSNYYNLAQQCQQLGYHLPRGYRHWDEYLIKALVARQQALEEIQQFHQFLSHHYLKLKDALQQGQSLQKLAEQLQQHNVIIPARLLIEYRFQHKKEVQFEQWDPTLLDVLWPLAETRINYLTTLDQQTFVLAEKYLNQAADEIS